MTEAAKICAALFCLFFLFNDLSGERLFRNIAIEWHMGRFVTIAIAYFIARTIFQEDTQRRKPLWQNLQWVFYSSSVIAILVWVWYAGLPSEPTNLQRDLLGSRLFVDILFPAIFGTYVSRREGSKKSMPPWLLLFARLTDFGIKKLLEAVNIFLYLLMVGGNAFITWAMGSVIIERAEIGWYLVLVIPIMLFSGSISLMFAYLPFTEFSVWLKRRHWKRLTRSKTDKADDAGK